MKTSTNSLLPEKHCDVTLPMNLDQVDLRDVSELVPKALDEPTDSCQSLLRRKISVIVTSFLI